MGCVEHSTACTTNETRNKTPTPAPAVGYQGWVFCGAICGSVAWLQTQPEFVMALLGVLSQDDGMSVVLLLFVILFVPATLAQGVAEVANPTSYSSNPGLSSLS